MSEYIREDKMKYFVRKANAFSQLGNHTIDVDDVAVIAFMSYLIRNIKKDNVDLSSFNLFINKVDVPSEMKKILLENKFLWSVSLVMSNDFSQNEWKEIILNVCGTSLENGRSDENTPKPILKIAKEILKSGDGNVLDACMGRGDFFVVDYSSDKKSNYTGIELNDRAKQTAAIRAYFLNGNYELVLADVLTKEFSCKYDKIFSNYPLMLSNSYLNDYKQTICDSLELDKAVVKNASSDWIFNLKITSLLSSKGKAVAICTNGDTWNCKDQQVRKYFIDMGKVEAVVALPSSLYRTFSIPVSLIVFSNGNESVKLVDGSRLFASSGKRNSITDEGIEEILAALSTSETAISVSVSNSEIASNAYIINPLRYIKDAELGDFDSVDFGEIITKITRGLQIKSTDLEKILSSDPTDYKYLKLSNIKDGMVTFDEDVQYLKSIPDNMTKYLIPNNAIVFSKIGAPNFKTTIVQLKENDQLLASGNLYIIEIDTKKANPFFMQAFFESEMGRKALGCVFEGAITYTLSIESLKRIKIPMIPLERQTLIGMKYRRVAEEYENAIKKLKMITEEKHRIFELS